MDLSDCVVIRWIGQLADIGDCLEEKDGIPCLECWEEMTDLVLVIATALEEGTL